MSVIGFTDSKMCFTGAREFATPKTTTNTRIGKRVVVCEWLAACALLLSFLLHLFLFFITFSVMTRASVLLTRCRAVAATVIK